MMRLLPVAVGVALLLLLSGDALAGGVVGKWARFWNVPPSIIKGIIRTESRGNPRAVAKHAGDLARGGAYGLMQMTLATATELVGKLRALKRPEVNATLRKWNGTGASLFDPDLNVLLGTYKLAADARALNQGWPAAILAYNRGRGGAAAAIASGRRPESFEYVQKATA
jgi:soluble lytic murein transglycosylase-like protein